ncbi:MAG: hypothetical protein ACREVH_07935 [Gammaproteobacteria bacterium]
MSRFTESTVESAALAWLEAIGWRVAYGPDIAPDLSACGHAQAGMPAAERADYGEVAVARLLRTVVSGEQRAEGRNGSLCRAAA